MKAGSTPVTPVPPVTLVTLVTGARTALREAAIASALPPQGATALILEGMPDGAALEAFIGLPGVTIVRIAAGCPCCAGNLVMTVTLNRILRRAPQRIFISLAAGTHVDAVRHFLSQPPYDALVTLTEDLPAMD